MTRNRRWLLLVVAVSVVASSLAVDAKADEPPPPAPPACPEGATTINWCYKAAPGVATLGASTGVIDHSQDFGGDCQGTAENGYCLDRFTMEVAPELPRCQTIYEADCWIEVDWPRVDGASGTARWLDPDSNVSSQGSLSVDAEWGWTPDDVGCGHADLTCVFRVARGFRNGEPVRSPTDWVAAGEPQLEVRRHVPPEWIEQFPDVWASYPFRTIWHRLEVPMRVLRRPLDLAPIAGFDINQFGPGEFQFASTSRDPEGGGLRLDWDLGDGTAAVGSVVGHDYTKPGLYSVRLTATDADGNSDTETKLVTVEAPELGLALGFPDSDDQLFEVGEEFDVRVTVSADTEGVGALSDVAFDGDPLQFTDALLDQVSGPVQVPSGADRTLEPGEELAFDYTLKATAPGSFTLLSKASAKDAAGRVVGPVDANHGGRIGQIKVEVTVTPDEVELEEGDDGPKPAPVTVTVKVTNPLDAPLENVTLEMENPTVVTDQARDPHSVPFTYLVDGPIDPSTGQPTSVPGKPEPVELGAIPAGEFREHTFKGQAQDEGTVDLRGLVLAVVDGRTIPGAGTGRLKVLSDVMLYFEAKPGNVEERDNGSLWQRGGFSWRIIGKIENRSADKSLLVHLAPQLTGNAFYALPIPTGEQAPDDKCAIGIVRQLEPGEEIEFSAPVRTLADGGTRGIVVYDPKGFIQNDDGTKTALTAEQILVKQGSREHTVHVQTFEPAPDPSAGELIYTFGAGTVEGLSRLAEGIGALASLALQAAALNFQPWKWPAAYQAAGDKAAEYFTHIYENLSPGDKAAWNNSVVSAVMLATGMSLTEARDMVDTAVLGSLEELQTAWYTGDSLAVARWWGRFAGENPDLVLQALVAGYGLCRLGLKGAGLAVRTLRGAAVKQAASLEARAAQGARALKVGDLLDYTKHLRNIFGVDQVSHRLLQDLAEKWNIIVVIRRRGVGVIEKLKTGKFTLKMEALKAKNVSEIDANFLGFKGRGDEVVIKEPPPWSEVQGKLGSADRELRTQVRERWLQRWEEWYGKGADPVTGVGGRGSHRAEWLGFERDGIPVPKNGVNPASNIERGFSIPADATLHVKRNTRIVREVGTDGRPQWVVQVDDPIKGWQGVTGDIDAMAFLRPDGTPLPPEARLQLYKVLRHLGFQHPETMTWTDVAGRNRYFQEFSVHNPKSEALAAYHPDGTVRATRFDPGRSWFDPANAAIASQMYFHGATTQLVSQPVTPADLEGVAPKGTTSYYIGPKTVVLLDKDCAGSGDVEKQDVSASAGGTCKVRFSNSDDALILRVTTSGLQRWTRGGGWQPFDHLGGPIEIRPQTSLSADAATGARRLPINEAADVGVDPKVDDWFQVGQTIVINPGAPNEEVAVISGFGSLVLDRKLQHDHAAGEMVTALTPVTEPSAPGGPEVRGGSDPAPAPAEVPPGLQGEIVNVVRPGGVGTEVAGPSGATTDRDGDGRRTADDASSDDEDEVAVAPAAGGRDDGSSGSWLGEALGVIGALALLAALELNRRRRRVQPATDSSAV